MAPKPLQCIARSSGIKRARSVVLGMAYGVSCSVDVGPSARACVPKSFKLLAGAANECAAASMSDKKNNVTTSMGC